MDVTVIVATFGATEWGVLAWQRAIPSVVALGVPYVHVHRGTLMDARNDGAALARSEWLCFVDADDEIEAGYFDAMAAGHTDLRAPLVRYVQGNHVNEPRIPAGTDDLADGNRLVIGTLIRKTMFESVGGFRDWSMYEDWDLWQRCWLAGATVDFTAAVYRAHMRADSRNRAPSHEEKLAAHHAIRRANMPWLAEYQDVRNRWGRA